jgi:hypothetical protein
MATITKAERDKIQSKLKLAVLLRKSIKPCKCLTQNDLCMEDFLEFRNGMAKKFIYDEKSHDTIIREKLHNSIKSVSDNFQFIKFDFKVVLNTNRSHVPNTFCRDCLCNLLSIPKRTFESRVSALKVRLLHDSIDVQQTASQVPYSTARSDNAPFKSLKEASKYNIKNQLGYTRREMQMLTMSQSEHDVYEWCEKQLYLIGK